MILQSMLECIYNLVFRLGPFATLFIASFFLGFIFLALKLVAFVWDVLPFT